MRLTVFLRAVKSTKRFASAKTTSATKQLEKYAVYNPVTLSLKDFVEFGEFFIKICNAYCICMINI